MYGMREKEHAPQTLGSTQLAGSGLQVPGSRLQVWNAPGIQLLYHWHTEDRTVPFEPRLYRPPLVGSTCGFTA